MNIRISKTKYLNGLQCKKLLWYIYHEPEAIPGPDEATQAIFDQGHLVGDYAKKLFPKGVEVDHTRTFEEGLRSTKKLISRRVPIFEAALTYRQCYARADILEPAGKDCWRRLRRAKSGGAVPLHFGDWIKDTLAAVFSKSGDSPFPGFGAVCQRCSDSGLREDSLFFAAIRPPVKRQKATVEAEAIQDRRSGGRIEDFSPVGGDEIRRDKGRGDFRTLGYNLKESVGLFFRGDHIAQFIQTKDMDARIIVDQRINVFGFGQLGRQIE